MMNQFDDMQRVNQANVDAAMKMMGEWGKGWQMIAAEMTDYTKRSVEDGTQTLEKLMSVKSLDQAFEIQTAYAKRTYEDYMHQLNKMGSLYAEFAKEAYRPFEKAMQVGR